MNNTKRKVYSEELFQQLGEQIPFLLQGFEEALDTGGLTLREYMDVHKGIAIDVLPKVIDKWKALARDGDKLSKALQRLEVRQNAFMSVWEVSWGEVGESLKPFASSMFRIAELLTKIFLPMFEKFADLFGPILSKILDYTNLLLSIIADLVANLKWAIDDPARAMRWAASGAITRADPLQTGGSLGQTAGQLGQSVDNTKVIIETNFGEMTKWFDVKVEQAQKGQWESFLGMTPSGE